MPIKNVFPTVTNELLTNPDIGFIAAPPLMGEQEQILDSRSKIVEKYKFAQNAKTYNHPDSGVWYCGARWQDLQPSESCFDFSSLEEKLEKAKNLGCTAIVRVAPYALDKNDDIPSWLRAKYPTEPQFPFWRIDPCTTEYPQLWAAFITELARRYDGHPLIAGIDMALVGAWGEGGGTEFMPEAIMELIIKAYTDNFKQTPLHALLHDPVSLKIIKKQNKPVGYRVDCLGDMGGFHKDWSHMLDFYPENIENFNMGEAWKEAPVVFEACWHMNDWYLQGWDIDYIIDQSLKWHISSYNSKATTVPLQWRESVENWVRKMGYRYEIRRFSYQDEIAVGGEISFEALITNAGSAPCYRSFTPVLRLQSNATVHEIMLQEDMRKYLPDEDRILKANVNLPSNLPEGEYKLSFGIKAPNGTMLMLAIELRDENGYYPLGNINIKGANA